ncbi:Undecaprenyl-phosphate galactose phosphotransferase [anaerobic digester metagenome]|uniref:Undecaprenyl-phosphate galactose phosphotransferase n=1 Tax=anaerobic digester metagenome TaxID=1263854 RepID=A0A485LY31_9ZZZZ
MINGVIKKIFLALTLMASDLAAIMASFALAYYVRSRLLVDVIPMFPEMIHGIDVYLKAWALGSLWVLIFAYEGLYPSIGMGFWDEIKSLLKGNMLCFVILILLTFVTKTTVDFSRPVIIMALFLSIGLLPLMRRFSRWALKSLGLWKKDVLIIGSPEAVRQVLCNLKKHPDWGLHPVGVVSSDGRDGTLDKALPVYRDIRQVDDAWIKPEEIIVAAPHVSRAELLEIVDDAMKVSPVVKMLPDLYGVASVGVKTYDLDGMLLLEMEDRLALKRNSITKRTFDILCAFIGLLVLSPLFLLIVLLIKLDSRGPAFFGHKRLGKGGRYFTCYKFRTMRPDAEQVLKDLLRRDPEARAQWEKDFKLKNDPRITKVGAFLRKTSLDELPQLWNVLKGDMSLVGPRPIVTDEVKRYGDKARYLFKVPPGITGLWQVSGRNDIDYEERVLLDEYYAKNWSLWLDIEVIIRTFGAVLKKQGAY